MEMAQDAPAVGRLGDAVDHGHQRGDGEQRAGRQVPGLVAVQEIRERQQQRLPHHQQGGTAEMRLPAGERVNRLWSGDR